MFVSAEYVAYNNSEIAQTAESLLRNAALSVKSFVLEETHMFLKLLLDEKYLGLSTGSQTTLDRPTVARTLSKVAEERRIQSALHMAQSSALNCCVLANLPCRLWAKRETDSKM